MYAVPINRLLDAAIGGKKMDHKSDDNLLIMQDNIETKKQYYDEKINKLAADLTGMIAPMMDQIKMLISSPYKKDSPKARYPITVVLANKKDPKL